MGSPKARSASMNRGWLLSWYRKTLKRTASRSRRPPRPRLQLELLETRNLLSGTSTPIGAQAFTTGTTPYSVTVADVNGDGKPDLITANAYLGATGGTVSVLLGNGDGTHQAAQNFPTDKT